MDANKCFICGGGPHERTDLHEFWSERDAFLEVAEYDHQATIAGAVTTPSMTAVETLDPREAVL